MMCRLALSTLALVCAAAAQETRPSAKAAPGAPPMQAPAPAPELAKLAVLVGNWKGKGTAKLMPGAPEQSWTSRSTAKWILDGHFVQEDVRIDMGLAVPMVMRSIYGWDRERSRYVVYACANSGEASLAELTITGKDEWLILRQGHQMGQPSIHREIAKFEKDIVVFSLEMATGTGDFTTVVQGKSERSEDSKPFAADSTEGSLPFGAIPKELEKFEESIGSWQMKGSMVPAPGMPKVEVSGKEKMFWLLGGVVFASHVNGDPIPGAPKAYEGLAFTTWDSHDACYRMFTCSNLGELDMREGRFVDPRSYVVTTHGPMLGVHSVVRAVVTYDQWFRPKAIVGDRMTGDGAAVRVFDGVYAKPKR